MRPDEFAPRLEVLTGEQCQQLYQAALECLERIGVLVHNRRGRELLAGQGARVEGERVWIPRSIIITALRTAPRAFSLWHTDGSRELVVDPDQVYFGPGPTCTYFMDPESGERRQARRGDAGTTARVCDALPNIDFVMSLSIYADVPAALSPVYEFADMLAASDKPVLAWANDVPTLQAIYRLAVAVAGGESELQARPFIGYFSTYQSPLVHKDDQMETNLWAAERGIPVIYLGGPTVGLESPVTAASGLVLYLAAVLSGLAIIQLAVPGAAVAVGGLPSPMDLRTVRPSYGAPEMSLNTAASAELARYLNLPFMGTAGATESKLIDAQAGVEVTSQVLFSMLSRAGLVHDVGFVDCADIGSMEMLVLADEVISYTKRIMRGIRVDEQNIMLELIEKVGPGGNFMTEIENVRLCRKEVWMPGLLDRDPYAAWKDRGGRSAAERASQRVKEILSRPAPALRSEAVLAEFARILEEEERRVADLG